MTFPDSAIARSAQELLRDTSPEHLVNHCLRSFVWAEHLAVIDDIAYDREVLFVAASLHDLGLLPSFDHGLAFELDGAAASRALVAGRGWPAPRADAVAATVELHVAEQVFPEQGGEVHLLWHATGLDVSGSRVGDLPPSVVRSTLALRPRRDFRTGFGDLFRDQAVRKPDTRAGQLVRTGILERIETCPLDAEGVVA